MRVEAATQATPRLFVGTATKDEVDHLVTDPYAALREAGVEIGGDQRHITVTRFFRISRDFDQPGSLWNILIYPGIDGDVVILNQFKTAA